MDLPVSSAPSDSKLHIFSLLKEIENIVGLKQVISFIVVVFAIHWVSPGKLKMIYRLKRIKIACRSATSR